MITGEVVKSSFEETGTLFFFRPGGRIVTAKDAKSAKILQRKIDKEKNGIVVSICRLVNLFSCTRFLSLRRLIDTGFIHTRFVDTGLTDTRFTDAGTFNA